MPHRRQSARHAAFIEKLAASKPSLWLRSIADMLARRITDGLVAFGEFIYPDFFETPAKEADDFRLTRARCRERGSDAFKRSEQAKGMQTYPTAWHRASPRRRRTR